MRLLQKSEKKGGNILLIPADKIEPNPDQPRKAMDTQALLSLSESIRQNGLLQPISVRRVGEGYRIIAGERRFRACVLGGMREIPCIVVDADAEASAVLALMENLQRSDLSFFEEAMAYESLLQLQGITQQKLAERLGLAQSTVANKLRLLGLRQEQRERIIAAGLSERQARALLRLKEEQRDKAIDKIITAGMNVNQTDAYIQQLLHKGAEKPRRKEVIFVKDVRVFLNTVNKAVGFMKKAGVDVSTARVDRSDHIEMVITIPKNKA